MSVRVTLVAVPAPLLVTVIVKPIGLPELTVALSAVFVTDRAGLFTVTVAVDVTSVWLVARAVAVLDRVPLVDPVVALITWTVADAVCARSPKLQVRT